MIPYAVAVLVPAHNEAELIGPCLRAIRTTLDRHAAQGHRTLVVVVAHRCTDATAARARLTLAGRDHLVIRDDVSVTVADVRRRAAQAALHRLGGTPATTWLLCTDADSVVPAGWIDQVLARSADSVAVAGMVALDGEEGRPVSRSHDRLVAEQVVGDWHGHTYGANLAVRADAYLAVGGFPRVAVGEDTALVLALAAAGLPVARDARNVVSTSGRLVGRAHGGLADLLSQLARDAEATADGVPSRGPGHDGPPRPVAVVADSSRPGR